MLTPVVGVVALGGGGGYAGGAGSSHGAAPSRPHGRDSVVPRPRAPKRTADPAGAERPAKRKHSGGHGRPTPVPVLAGSPIALARAVAEAATAEGAVFCRSRSDLADQAEVEGRADSDLGLDPNDAEALAWRDRNRAEAESVRSWTDAAAAWARPGAEPVSREMPEGTVVAATVFEPSSVRERVVEVEDDTPPRANMAERARTDGGGGGVVLEEALRAAASEAPPVLEEAPRAVVPEVTPAAGPETATQGVPASGSETATQGVPEEVLAASRAASGEHALLGNHLDAFRVAAFNRLLGRHRELVERLAAKEELRIAAAEVLSWRTRLLRAGDHYDRLIADTSRLGVEAAQARSEAAAARQSLDEANRLHEQLAGQKSHLDAEVELLKAEAAKVAEVQHALVEVDQQRGQLADDKGRLQAKVDHLRGQVTTAEGARQDEARHRGAAEKAAEDKDAELKAALAKAADLEKALEERDRAIERERRGAFPETQRLAEEAVRYQRDPIGVVGSGTDPRVA
nr:uncharacterized protein LOC109731864 [Aegilops tauschii subsp. strangulata]